MTSRYQLEKDLPLAVEPRSNLPKRNSVETLIKTRYGVRQVRWKLRKEAAMKTTRFDGKKKERHVTTHSNHRKSHKMSVQFNCRCQTVTIPSQFGCGEANGKNDESFRAACDAVLRVDSCFVFVCLEKLGRNKKNSVRPKNGRR